jgi:peptidoglycan lytic transglycosylase G
VKDLDAKARDLEGYLFPETYSLPRRADASRVVAMMVDRFRASYDDTLRARAEAQQLTTRQVVTLASLIEKETARADERPIVAAVYRNRIKQGMGMQADPTVVYALMKAGKYDGNIRREDLNFDSPYNTYRYPGLPPGPIAAPGRASLEAALSPADVPYLYFVSRNDGSHVFATTLKEHNANVYQYQVLYFRAQRTARASGAGGRAGGPSNASPEAPRRR